MSENKTRGLGRGLSALMGEMPAASRQESANALRDLPIELVHPNSSQPRRVFDVEELATLAATIKEHGVVQPIVVREIEGKRGEYSIIAGERRWRASQIAGLHKIPAVIRNYDDLETLKIAIVENLQRANLNPLEEAMAFEQLAKRFGYNQQSIADSIGKSRVYVTNSLRLLGLDDEIKEMLSSGQISAGHARALLASDNPKKLAKEIIEKSLSVRQAEKRASQSFEEKAPKLPLEASADILSIEENASLALGMNVKIKTTKGESGSVIIEYKNLEQLEEIFDRITKKGLQR